MPPRLSLASFRVRMYQSIRDSGTVPVFPLTALVGRHRSGKTSLLRAVQSLDPDAANPLSVDVDWPRESRRARHRDHVVCSGFFRCREAPGRAADDESTFSGVRVDRTYGGELSLYAWNGNANERTSNANDDAAPPGGISLEHLPVFLFADHDSLLPGTVPTDLAKVTEADEGTGTAALSRLLGHAGLDADELQAGADRRAVRDGGERVDALLTEHGFAGGISRGLSLDLDRGRIALHLEHHGRRTRVDRLPANERFRLTIDLRLLAADIAESPGHERGTVLLLDGPGRFFRREARPDMRALFCDYVDRDVTVLYTSRLPFDIELQHAEQVLVLSPGREGDLAQPCRFDPPSELAVRAALGMTGRTSFTVNDLNLVVEGTSDARILQALDEVLQRSSEAGLPTDVTLTRAQGAEDVAAISTFLGRQGLGVIALFDSDNAGRTAAEHLRTAFRKDERFDRVVILDLARAAHLDRDPAAIEDLFPTDAYLRAVQRTCSKDTAPIVARVAKEDGGNPAARLARAFDAVGKRFKKGSVIAALTEKLDGTPTVDDLPPGMAPPVRRLMESIRSAADRLRD